MITMDELTEVARDTTREMRVHAERFSTPVTTQLTDRTGELVGTGGYVEVDGRRVLLTNEHVARRRRQSPLGHKFVGCDEYYLLAEPTREAPSPIDAALVPISDQVWSRRSHNGAAVPQHRIAHRHSPVPRELLFILGCSGERSYYSPGYKTLFTMASPHVTQEQPTGGSDPEFDEVIKSEYWDPLYHFALLYRPDLAIPVDGRSEGLPMPPGFSGSLVWNTRRIESLYGGRPWSAEEAVLTGLIWGWPSSEGYLFATRIEHILPLLSHPGPVTTKEPLRAGD
jgi:hypothetical protein